MYFGFSHSPRIFWARAADPDWLSNPRVCLLENPPKKHRTPICLMELRNLRIGEQHSGDSWMYLCHPLPTYPVSGTPNCPLKQELMEYLYYQLKDLVYQHHLSPLQLLDLDSLHSCYAFFDHRLGVFLRPLCLSLSLIHVFDTYIYHLILLNNYIYLRILLFVIYPPWNQHSTRKLTVGRLLSFWAHLFSGATVDGKKSHFNHRLDV